MKICIVSQTANLMKAQSDKTINKAGFTVKSISRNIKDTMSTQVILLTLNLLQVKINLAERKYFQSAKSGKITIGEPVISKVSGEPAFVIAVPLRNSSGTFAGIFGSVVKLTALSEKITQTKIGETGYPFMVGNDGLFIAHPVKDYIFKLNMAALEGMEEIAKKSLAQETGVEKYRFKGVDKIAGFASVPATEQTSANLQMIVAAAEEMSATINESALELSKLAENLNEMVGRFKL